MARKVTPRKPAAQAAGTDDLEKLFPDRTLTIAGEEITVREYRFLEGLKVQAIAEPVVAALAQIAMSNARATPAVQDAVLSEHADVVAQMIALACDKSVEWVARLRGAEGEALQQAWWSANAGFFVRRVRQRALAQALERAKASAGSASSPRSPVPATATKSSSSATPSVN